MLDLTFQKLEMYGLFKLNSSLLIILIINDIGVNKVKKIIPNTIGFIIKLNMYPRLIQILFKGCSSLGAVNEIAKNISERNRKK